ncbi:MAG: hypothetical protein AAGD33_22205 [Actinomycetota bacterium]
MTIGKGSTWGSAIPRPADLDVVHADADLADALSDGIDDAHVAVQGGDLWRTLGARTLGDRSELQRMPIDLVDVILDDGVVRTSVAHVVAHEITGRGGIWRGPVAAVMNAEWVGEFDVAPRGHPNDGRVELVRLDPTVGIRQRLAIRRRMRTGSHLPHPGITVRPVREHMVEFDRPLVVRIDGRPMGRSATMSLRVRPDAAHVLT